jgi:hypothetical protein
MVNSPVFSAPVQRALPGAAVAGGSVQSLRQPQYPSDGADQSGGWNWVPSDGADQSGGWNWVPSDGADQSGHGWMVSGPSEG